MRQKVIVRGPALSQSGYGVHARFVLDALRSREDLFDIYLENLNWGRTSWLWEDNEDRKWIDFLLLKTVQYRQQGGLFDVSLQVTIPNEWENIAQVNIGCTAGIETTKIAPNWVEKSYMMDKIIVVSNFAREGFVNTVYEATNNATGEVHSVTAKGPIDVVNYSFRPAEKTDINIELKHDFNFLVVSQWSVRKNFENTIRWFIEEFIDQEVGIVLKTSMANNSYIDFEHVKGNIAHVLADPKYEDRKCSVNLVHGYMTDGEMASLYQHPKIKSIVNIAHGEGFGLPIFEAAGYGTPIITVAWGGQCDFLYVPEKVKGSKRRKNMPKFCSVEYELMHVQKEAVWEGVLQADSQWAYPEQGSFKMSLRDMYKKYSVHKKRALALQKHIANKFSEEAMWSDFIQSVVGALPGEVSDDTDLGVEVFE